MTTLSRVSVSNFLSLRDFSVDLGGLIVLVGANGVGKSNLLSVFRFLGEVARSDLRPAIESFGGYEHLRFRGARRKNDLAGIKIKISGNITKHASLNAPDEYSLSFFARPIRNQNRSMLVRNEDLVLKRRAGRGRRITLKGSNVELHRSPTDGSQTDRTSSTLKVQSESSGLAILRRLGDQYDAPQVEELASVFEELRLFEVNVALAKKPSSRVVSTRLEADGSNLASFLNYLKLEYPFSLEAIEEDMQSVLPGFERFIFDEIGGSRGGVLVSFKESYFEAPTSLARASFGTVRAIALFAMLQDPNPPRLTCLEEVDHGLHPYALDRLVERLRDATANTQIIMATHSPALVNRLKPEELVILERDSETGETYRPNITAQQLREMEEDSEYNLGELWFSGLIGGIPV